MSTTPNVKNMAKEAIRKHPHLLKDSAETQKILIDLMIKYRDICDDYRKEKEPEKENNLPIVFTDIFKLHNLQT